MTRSLRHRPRLPAVLGAFIATAVLGAPVSSRASGHGHGGHEEHGGHDEHEDGPVRLSPAALARLGLHTAAVTLQPMQAVVTARADIVVDQTRTARITARSAGVLGAPKVQLGDAVRAGDVLVTVRSADLAGARARLSRAKAARAVAEASVQRQQTLKDQGVHSEKQRADAALALAQAEAEVRAARAALAVRGQGARGPGEAGGAAMALVSPMDGVVMAHTAIRGQTVAADDVLFDVADTSAVWVLAHVPEATATAVKPGMRATLSVSGAAPRTAEVAAVAGRLDPHTRTRQVRLALSNADGALLPGAQGTVTVFSPGAAMLTVPTLSVQRVKGQDVVFVEVPATPAHGEKDAHGEKGTHDARGEKGGHDAHAAGGVMYAMVPVVVLETAGGLHGIRPATHAAEDVLKDGARVVTKGAFVLKSMRTALGSGHAH